MASPTSGLPGKNILVVLSAHQFCISGSGGDEWATPDASGRCTLSWHKYTDLGESQLVPRRLVQVSSRLQRVLDEF